MTDPVLPEHDVDGDSPHRRSLIGTYPNHWLYSASPPSFDLTRPSPPEYAPPSPKDSISLSTTTTSVVISPAKTALVIIDMQNFFLSTHLGRPADGAGNIAKMRLVDIAIPAARRAGIQIIWLNWGLTNKDLDLMPPSTLRAFGFEAALGKGGKSKSLPAIDPHGNGKPKRIYKGLGSEIGPVTIEDGKVVDAGRLLMRDTWNAALPPALDEAYKEGRLLKKKPDVWVNKIRMSGLWGSSTPCTDFLEQQGIKTLLFSGVNTDQCVGGSLQDAFTKGWDCILLKDACGTTSPQYATECMEYNSARTWGFVTDCDDLDKGIKAMLEVQ
ncbi:isochorismatase family protein [Usnea florida]